MQSHFSTVSLGNLVTRQNASAFLSATSTALAFAALVTLPSIPAKAMPYLVAFVFASAFSAYRIGRLSSSEFGLVLFASAWAVSSLVTLVLLGIIPA